ncbi:terminase large subunit domain-containing protein [Gordonia neofelifaecis]|uniref:Putative phage terminase protein n=1 Tax=Gordonia neofelifaecis NRRL B-59395 TaxID=644548 RepID=F1YQ06_9ACTN|nr:terminase family protein [Gordonia neofelifaecis]EGD53223.1 putative phage terminase protein [Gordonia neofelifaecis NRRL B-59395]
MSELLGRPLMPWQILAADLIGECDASGRLIHPLVVVTVPRQSGKTALLAAVMLHRLIMLGEGGRVWYTAQTGIKAREQMWEMMDAIDRSALGPLIKSKRGAGDTSMELLGTGARAKMHPPTPDSLHGNQSDLNVIDEAWFFDEPQAHGLMGAITPTQSTRPNAQTIIISTAGTAESVWFHDLVARGHDGALCLVDYGVADGVTPDDYPAIAAAHPAIGHTQKAAILPAAREQLSSGEFLRAYGNVRTRTESRLLPAEIVDAATTTTPLPATGAVVFGCALSFERDDAAIVACMAADDGTPVVELVARFTSAEGVAARCAELTDRHGGHVAIAPAGPAGSIADDADRLGATVTRYADAELSSSTADFLDRIRATPPTVRIRAHEAFTDAFDAAALRTSGDRLHWSRRGSAGSIAVLEAATLAVRALADQPAPPTRPMIWS